MLVQEERSNMSARESELTNIEEDAIFYRKDCCAGQGMRDVLDSHQRLALYISEHVNFSTSFEQRLAMQSAQERKERYVYSSCEQKFCISICSTVYS